MLELLSIHDFEKQAKEKLNPKWFDFIAAGSADELTLQHNRLAFEQIKLRPRVLTGGFIGKLNTEILGCSSSMPVIIAPTAFHCLLTERGECDTASAAYDHQILMIVSMAATQPIEIIATYLKNGYSQQDFWFQIYLQSDRNFNQKIIQKVESAGAKALVVTVDSPVRITKEKDIRNQFLDLPKHLTCHNMRLSSENKPKPIEFNSKLNWRDIDWLRQTTQLPILLKGIAHPFDAKLAIECGVDGIIVSNHGGRQLDGIAASIDLLPDIASVINRAIPIILDGGIRRGIDILKALALGADAISIGRPILWGLALGGIEGVKRVLNILRDELKNALHLCGCTSLSDLNPSILYRVIGK